MSAAPQGNRRASGALAVLLLLLLLVAGGGFAGVGILQTMWLELDALQTQLDALQRRRPTAQDAAAAAISVKPFLAEENFASSAPSNRPKAS
jgi:hypothetical protein